MGEMFSPEQLLEMLEGNRRLTIRTIEAFPEEALFQYRPTEALRPFADMVTEIIGIEEGYMSGIATGTWVYPQLGELTTKAALLEACHATREKIRQWWPQVTVERLTTVEKDPFFGEFPQPNLNRVWYMLENEIHHRGQGFIYLRLLGQEPPVFYER